MEVIDLSVEDEANNYETRESAKIITFCSTIIEQQKKLVNYESRVNTLTSENNSIKRKYSEIKSVNEKYSEETKEHMKKIRYLEKIIKFHQDQTFVCYHCNLVVPKLECDIHLEECEACPICKERNTVEKKLIIKGCGHKICERCIFQIEDETQIKCPICRTISRNDYIKEI